MNCPTFCKPTSGIRTAVLKANMLQCDRSEFDSYSSPEDILLGASEHEQTVTQILLSKL